MTKDGSFTREDFESLKKDLGSLFNSGKQTVFDWLDKAKEKLSKVKEMFNTDVHFAKVLKAKYDALRKAGFDEKEAFDLTLRSVEKILREKE